MTAPATPTAADATGATGATTVDGAGAVSASARPALGSLTGLRWVAAFGVFGSHVDGMQYVGGQGGQFVAWALHPGSVGVSFFFVLSGFVLVWSARDGDAARTFWRRRFARVYPLHLVTAVIALVLAFTVLPGLRPRGPGEVVANLALVSSWWREWWQAVNPVSWSLTCEAFFYAMFPLLHAGLRRRGPRALALLAVATTATVIVLPPVIAHLAPTAVPATNPAARAPEFVLGAVLGRLVLLGAWRGPGLGVATVLVVAGYFLTEQVPRPYAFSACTIVGFALLVAAAASADLRGLPSIWRRPVLVRLGEWSFAFYMIHVLVMQLERELQLVPRQAAPLPGLAAAAAVFAVALALSWALHRGVELPARTLLLRPVRVGRTGRTGRPRRGRSWSR